MYSRYLEQGQMHTVASAGVAVRTKTDVQGCLQLWMKILCHKHEKYLWKFNRVTTEQVCPILVAKEAK